MGRFEVRYKIDEPIPAELYPSDEFSGVLGLGWDGKKPKDVKKVEIQLREKYEYTVWSKLLESYENKDKDKLIQKNQIAEQIHFEPGTIVELAFKIKLPVVWNSNPKNSTRNWCMILDVKVKAGKLGTKTVGTIILPVAGSMRIPMFGGKQQPVHTPIVQQNQSVVVNVGKEGASGEKEIETKFCSLCGKKIKKEALFCEHCGGSQ